MGQLGFSGFGTNCGNCSRSRPIDPSVNPRRAHAGMASPLVWNKVVISMSMDCEDQIMMIR